MNMGVRAWARGGGEQRVVLVNTEDSAVWGSGSVHGPAVLASSSESGLPGCVC